MYKTTQDAADYINRVASHATKESRRGIIKNVPSWAAEPEEYYNSLLEQFETLSTRLHKTRERVIWLRQQLKNTLPFETYTKLRNELDFAGPLLTELEHESGFLRLITRAASTNSWGAVFYFLAEKRLEKNIFREIDEEVKKILNRDHQILEKKKSRPEMSEQARMSLKQKERRQMVRKKLKEGTYKSFIPHSGTWHAR